MRLACSEYSIVAIPPSYGLGAYHQPRPLALTQELPTHLGSTYIVTLEKGPTIQP